MAELLNIGELLGVSGDNVTIAFKEKVVDVERNTAINLAREGAAAIDEASGGFLSGLNELAPGLLNEIIMDDPNALGALGVAGITSQIASGGITIDTIKDVLGQDGLAYKYLPPELKQTSDIVMAAIDSNLEAVFEIDLPRVLPSQFQNDLLGAIVNKVGQNSRGAGILARALSDQKFTAKIPVELKSKIEVEASAIELANFPSQALRRRRGEDLEEWEQAIAALADPTSIRYMENPSPTILAVAAASSNGQGLDEVVQANFGDNEMVVKYASEKSGQLRRSRSRFT